MIDTLIEQFVELDDPRCPGKVEQRRLEDSKLLCAWAEKGFAAALRSPYKAPTNPRRAKKYVT